MPDEEEKWRQKRRHPRIAWGFLVRHKPHGPAGDWTDLSTVKNISAGGCYFGSQKAYRPGEILDLEVKLPGVKDLLRFEGDVKRCDAGAGPGMWFVAVEFINMDYARKDEFTRVISFFLKKQNRKE